MILLKKVFDCFIWVLFFVLLFIGGIIYVSSKTYPGDYLYSYKLKFENFALATSKVMNKQIDFSIDLVGKRSNEATTILRSKYGKDGLDRLSTQVELTATSISEITDPVEKKQAAEKYIVKLNEVSSVLSQKQKDLVTTTTQPTSNNFSQGAVGEVAQEVIRKVTPTVTQYVVRDVTQNLEQKITPEITVVITQAITQKATPEITRPISPTVFHETAKPTQNIPPTQPVEPTSQVRLPTVTPATEKSHNDSSISHEIDKTQEKIKKAIDRMNNLSTESTNNDQDEKKHDKSNTTEKEAQKDKNNDNKSDNSNKETNTQ